MAADTVYPATPALFAKALVDFSRNGLFPDDAELPASHVTNSALQAALTELTKARSELESEIKAISRNTAPDVDQWIRNAKSLQSEIAVSRLLAKTITRSADKGDSFQQNIKDLEAQIAFLEKEQIYQHQVGEAVKGIRKVHLLLNEAEEIGSQNLILDALHELADAAAEKHIIPALESGRPLIMLEDRYVRIYDGLHEQFLLQWKYLVNVDKEAHSITIRSSNPAGGVHLDSVYAAMQGFGEYEERMKALAAELKEVIFEPRFKLRGGQLPLYEFDEQSVRLSYTNGNSDVRCIITDLEKLLAFLNSKLPPEIHRQLSQTCGAFLSDHMRTTWLDQAVPVRLGDEMTEFRQTMGLALGFSETLDGLGWEGSSDLLEWVESCAKIWLKKRREHCLDLVRNRLAIGVSLARKVERIEREFVKQSETTDADDWDANWDDEKATTGEGGDDWGGDAWGFGDDVDEGEVGDNSEAEASESPKKASRKQAETSDKMVTLTESYTISSMPGPVFDTIIALIEDALTLSDPDNESNPITPAAGGLFGVPSHVLAMYRAVAPYHYSTHTTGGGRMYQYNDSMWLCDQLEMFIREWQNRTTTAPRAHGKIKFEKDIQIMQRWGKRAYADELAEQKTIINDLLGGAQSFLAARSPEQMNIGGWGFDEPTEDDNEGGVEKMIDGVVEKIRNVTTTWKKILSKSAWAQATGALLNVVAKKIVADIQDRDSLGSDECELIARAIEKVLRLDDLFVPENLDASDPMTPRTSLPPATTKPSSLTKHLNDKSDPPSPSKSSSLGPASSDSSFPFPDESPTLDRSLYFLQNASLSREQKSDLLHERIKSGEVIPLTSSYVDGWLRLQYTKEILESDLRDLRWLWLESELSLHFDAVEVVEFVERCFAGSERRKEVLGVVRANPRPRGL